ncbi:ribonuclease H-like domain-containing protein, partial [Tanacetum coccineum]
ADCNYHQRERVISRNNYIRVHYNYSAKKAHPSAYRNMVPRAVLMKTGLRSLNTARPVNTAHPKTICHPQKEDQGYVDSGCLRHMTSNMSYLSDFKEFDGGYVTFGGGAKGGRIAGKGTLKTGKLDFKDLYFVRELQTLIEAARTMLADSKLPTTIWAKSVNTACYVQNKFDRKSDEGFFVGYSLNSKAFRVYNIRTRKVEENLHIRFLEDKPIIASNGPKYRRNTNVNTGSLNINTVSPIVTTAPLEATHADFFGDETEIDMSNITTAYLFLVYRNNKDERVVLHFCMARLKRMFMSVNLQGLKIRVPLTAVFKKFQMSSMGESISLKALQVTQKDEGIFISHDKDSNEKKLILMIKIHTHQNIADLLAKAFDVGRFQYLITSIGMLNL